MHTGPNASRELDFLQARHFRAARALLDWTQDELARKARVVRRTIVMLESGECRTQPRKVQAVLAALGSGGIRFARSSDGEISLIDGHVFPGPIDGPVCRGIRGAKTLRTRVSGRHPAVV